MKGFSLIEVLVALFVIMAFFAGISKITILSARSCRYSEDLSCAATLGHSKLIFLGSLQPGSSDLSLEWHQDPLNPIVMHNKDFYCFWQVTEVSVGKKVNLFVAWNDNLRGYAGNFDSLADLKGSSCPHIDFTDILLDE
ncbi:MAG: prepilin-type N-terminal cleavage/methylation domain-containing protein [Deltaproteobacteria bacterium]|nr:prepilin-type N-terminal cleavage/methylation domain-containing protein [Deltaproteobacteria bacterium]